MKRSLRIPVGVSGPEKRPQAVQMAVELDRARGRARAEPRLNPERQLRALSGLPVSVLGSAIGGLGEG